MFLPWSLISRNSKKNSQGHSSHRQGNATKAKKPLRKRGMQLEVLEDRLVPTKNIFVNALANPVGANGSLLNPWINLQQALDDARVTAGPDKVFVYGNNSDVPYLWTRDEDRNPSDPNNSGLDGNMIIGFDKIDPNDPFELPNTVEMYFRASVINPFDPLGAGGADAPLVVKMRDNIIDVRDGSMLRAEGHNNAARVYFTSFFDSTVGGDSDGSGNSPQRANWGGIRYRADAVDQGPDLSTGSLINWADIRYTGQTVFDEVAGFPAEFASIRMEANATNPADVRGAQVRVWNTVFQHGGRALDINLNALGDGGKVSSVITGPDLGAATAQDLTFIDNTINGAFIFIPADFFTGNIQQLFVSATLDDVGVPYVITQRLILARTATTPGLPGQVTLTFNSGTILKSQNTGLDGIDFGEPNDRTFGNLRVNGTVNEPVLFTSLTDDELVPNTDLAALYNNGSIDTNNDADATTPLPGDWGGIRIANGNIDHAFVRYGGGFTQVTGTFVNWPAIRVFARDLTPAGGPVQQVRISNTDVSLTFSDTDVDSPAIDLFSRDDGDTRFAGPFAPIVRTGDVQIMDNNVHNNQGKAIQAHPLYYHDARNTLGGYGVFFRRNIIEENLTNGVFTKFILDFSRGIDQNLPSVGGVWDDSDIVHVIEGQALITTPDQYFQAMSRRGILPAASSGGYLERFVDQATFLSNLKLRLPGNLPTDLTKPLELLLQQGPTSVNSGLVDSGLFYYLTNFDSTSRSVANPVGTQLRGEEWRDWGVNFVFPGNVNDLNDPLALFPFVVDADPNNPTGRILRTNTSNGGGTFEMVFPNAVSAVGFFINNNVVTTPNEKIELFAADGRLIDSAPLPVTAPNGRTYFARISRTPIHRVRITEDVGDSSQGLFSSVGSFPFADNTLVEVPINIGSNFNFTDLNVQLNITHNSPRDLILELVGPNGQVVPLAQNTVGGTTLPAPAVNGYIDTFFDDGAPTPIALGGTPFTGSFSPVSFDPFDPTKPGLSAYLGTLQNATAGTWRLRVRDADPVGFANNIGGTVNNVKLFFTRTSAAQDQPGISGLVWVDSPESLVVKANTDYTTITAAGTRGGAANQDAQGVLVNGFTPQMINQQNGANAQGQFTFGQSTGTNFTRNTPMNLINGGETIVPLSVNSDFVSFDMAVQLNLAYSGLASQLRVRLRAPDGTEIELVGQNSATGTGGFTNTVFDDVNAQRALNTPNNQAPYTNTYQSWSYTNIRQTAPTTNTPYGLSFFRNKNVRGTWALVITKQDGQTGTLNNFTLSFRAPVQGWGSTFRVLGQGSHPVYFTGIQDDSVGAGPINHVQNDNGSDGPTTAAPGQWRGIQILPGVNTSLSEVVTQNPNGTINRRYADLNPYTRFDEGLTYPGLNNPNGTILSYQDEIINSLHGTNAGTTAATRAPFESKNNANLQDGVLLEYANIRFATTGIDQRGYPRNKLTIDGNEYEPSTSPNESLPNAATTVRQPLPNMVINQLDQVRFETMDGTYRVAGRLGGTGQGQFTDDVDWFELPNNTPGGRTVGVYVDIERGRRTAGNDEPTNRPINIAVFNHEFQLIYWSGVGGTGLIANSANGGNTLGPIQLVNGDIPFTQGTGFTQDAKWIAVMPGDRVPRSFVSTQAAPPGLLPDMNSYLANFNQSDVLGADGTSFLILVNNQSGTHTPVTNDSIYDTGALDGTVIGGYEMELRMVGFERQSNPPKPAEGQILIRSNTILSSSGPGISLSDYRMNVNNTNLGATMPLQAARFPFNATNLSTNSNGNVFRNEDVNNVNPAFSAPANFVPGPTVHNNLIVLNQGDGIVHREDRLTNNVTPPAGIANPVPYSSNIVTPTAFTEIFNNTIDRNTGTGINLFTRGGPTVQNNIVTNNGVGMNITDGYDIFTNTPPVVTVVSYNIFFNNPLNGVLTGSQNLSTDPQYVDPNILDYRLKLSSPGVDSAISDLQDRLRSARFPQKLTRAPGLDLRGRARVDNTNRPNVGAGAFPFYDRGALETNELPLRVIGLSVLTDNGILGSPFDTIVITFSGRVEATTFNASFRLTRNGVTVPFQTALVSNVYDPNTDTHTYTVPFASENGDGSYVLTLDGSTAVGLKDIAGQFLDGEFPAPYKLPSGNGAPGGNFLYPFRVATAKIAGQVWLNPNGNSTIDPGETFLNGVDVNLFGTGPDNVLFTTDDELIDSQVTSGSGNYLFSNLASALYYVEVDNTTLPGPNYILNTPPAQRVISLPLGSTSAGNNFGYWIDNGNAVVNGRVFIDLNANGTYQPGEESTVMNGLTVTLISAGPDFTLDTADDFVFNTVITSGNLSNAGTFSFSTFGTNVLAGNRYRLVLDDSTLGATFQLINPASTTVDLFVAPDTTVTQDFAYLQSQSIINGFVFDDANGNGTRDGGEVGLSNVFVYLRGAGLDGVIGTPDDIGAGPDNTFGTADDVWRLATSGGNYSFVNLSAGNYQVFVDSGSPVLANFFLTTGNNIQLINLPTGDSVAAAADVGYRQDPLLGRISGAVFVDTNFDNIRQPGETAFANVPIQIRWAGRNGIFNDSDDQIYNLNTDIFGAYDTNLIAPPGLPVGSFRIFSLQDPPAPGLGLIGTNPINANLGIGQFIQNQNFTYQAAASVISGAVFNDLNGNGILDGLAEPDRFSSIIVFVDSNNNGFFDFGERQASVVSGNYTFNNLPAGSYRVKLDPLPTPGGTMPIGFVPTTDLGLVVVDGSNQANNRNLGVQQRDAKVFGTAFFDSNNNGVKDPGEAGAVGQTATLDFLGTPPVNFTDPQVLTITDPSGQFVFENLPAGSYTVTVTGPSGSTVLNSPRTYNNIAPGGIVGQGDTYPIQFGGGQGAGVFYMTFSGNSTTLFNSDNTTLVVNNTDIVRLVALSPSDWHYDVFIHGADVGLSAGGTEAIDAFTFTNDGDIIVSTRGTFNVQLNYIGGIGVGQSITGFGEDLLRFSPTATTTENGISEGTWSLFFKGSRVGLSGASENVDAVSLVYTGSGNIGRILLSTTGSALVGGGLTASPVDVLAFAPTNFGNSTSGTFSRFFRGGSFGLNDPVGENVDALFYIPNTVTPTRPSLLISTAGNFAVPGFTGVSNDMLKFNATSGGPVGLLAGSFGSVAFTGSTFGQSNANISGFWLGTTASDPNPFGNGGSGSLLGGGEGFMAGQLVTGNTGSYAASFVSNPSPVKSSLNQSSKLAAAASSTAKVGISQADQFFSSAKRQRTSVFSLAKSLLSLKD